MRALIASTVLYPSDAVSTERLTAAAARVPGIVYIRTTRPKTAVIYDNDEEFPIGGSKTLRASPADRVAIIAAGVTLHEALAAHDSLRRKGVHVRVIDAYSIRPLDEEAFARAARETGSLVVVEDHAIDGGLGEAVAAAVDSMAPVPRLGVHELPRSAEIRKSQKNFNLSGRHTLRHARQSRARSILSSAALYPAASFVNSSFA